MVGISELDCTKNYLTFLNMQDGIVFSQAASIQSVLLT